MPDTIDDMGVMIERQRAEVLRLRVVGYNSAQIGERLDKLLGGPISRRQVDRILKSIAEEQREENFEYYEQMQSVQVARLEWLYSICARRMEEAGVDDKLIRAAVMVLDRQAKLLGLDARGPMAAAGSSRDEDWIKKAPIADVIKLGESLGMKLPTAKF